MGSRIDALRDGGYSDEEIAAWSTERRDTLTNAGFKDNEIDAYFTGGVAAPEKMPTAFTARIEAGNIARAREGGLMQTVPQGAAMMQTPAGRSALWEAVKQYPMHLLEGMIDTLKIPGDTMSGKIDMSTDEGVDEAIGLGTLVGFGRFSKLPTTGKTSGLSIKMGEPFARIERSATGEIHETPIGTLPTSEDFVAAAKVTAGPDAPMPVQEKLLRAYEEQGRHPAEVATDAQADPIVQQRLLSKDPKDMPYIDAYHGSPHEFEAFSMEKIGTGEGAQSYGHGLYLAEKRGVAESYAGTVEPGSAAAGIGLEGGNLYRVRIRADRENFLDWDKPLSEQSPQVKAALKELGVEDKGQTGGQALRDLGLTESHHDPALGSQKLREAGIPGIKYLDQGSRQSTRAERLAQIEEARREVESGKAAGAYTEQGLRAAEDRVARLESKLDEEGTHNFVVFDDTLLEITHKNGTPVTPKDRAAILEGAGGGGKGKPPEPPEPGSFEDAQKKILDKISVGGHDIKRPWTFDRLYTEAIDDLHPIKAVSEDAYQMARLTRGQFGKAEYFLEHGTFDFNTYKTTGRPLREILAPVRDDFDGLRAYLASKRAIELEGRGLKSGFDLEAAQKVATEGGEKYGAIASELVEYQKSTLQYLKDSGILTEESFQAMVEANKNYVPFYRLITPEKAPPGAGGSRFGPGNPVHKLKGSERAIIDPLESIIKNTYAYVSIAERNAVGSEIINALQKEGFKVELNLKYKGDAELQSYLKEHGVKEPEKLAEFIRSAGVVEEGEAISAYRNGVRESVKVDDPELVAAFRGLDRQSAGLLVRVFSVPAKTLRAGAVLSPDFITRNVIRDFMTAFVNTGKGVFTPIDTIKGLTGIIRTDADFQNWLKAGGANSTMVALDRAYLQESLTKLAGETGLMERSWNVVKHPIAEGLKPLRMVSEMMENATRLGEFKRLARGEIEPSKATLQGAAYGSREVTLDFARMGARMRSYNMLTAFANAQIQGVDRTIRAFKDRPLNTTAKVAAGITVPSVLLWWANHGDPRYEELPHWQKDLFWIILTDKWEPIDTVDAASKPSHLVREKGGRWEMNNGSIWRIPKPFEMGIVFGTGPERVLDATVGKNPEAFAGFTKSVLQVLTPNFIPTAAQPVIEQFANRSTFTDRTLIPADLEKHLPEYQYTPYTTQLSRKLGQVLSSFPGMREAATDPGSPFGGAARAVTTPILIENYVRAWTGGLGMYTLEAADAALRKAGVLPDPIKPTATLADIPFVRAFAVRYPSATTQSLQDFHDEYKVGKKFFDTWMARAQEGDTEAMARIQAAGGPQMFLRLDEINNVLTDHSKLIRDVYKNPDIPAAEKRQLIDTLYHAMIQIGRAGRDIQRQVKKTVQEPVP